MSDLVATETSTPGALPDAGEWAACIIKQVAAKMTAFGLPNNPHGARAGAPEWLSASVGVVEVYGIYPAPVFALVVHKGHAPHEAWHVVDFRVGSDIYSAARTQ
jgi:hypothetical protein